MGRTLLWTRRLVGVGVLGAVFGVVAEAVCRIEERIAFGVPFMSRVGTGDLVLIDTSGARGRPHGRYSKWQLNSLGFRGPEVPRTVAPKELRVFMSGASETFGLYETPHHEYPRQLEDSLRGMLAGGCGAGGPEEVRVVNGSLPGMSLPSMVVSLHRDVPAVMPRVIVLYPSPAFYLDVRLPAAPRATTADTALPFRNALEPRLLTRLRNQFKELAPAPVMTALRQWSVDRRRRQEAPGWVFESVPQERLVAFERDLREAVGAARASGKGAGVVLMQHVNVTMAPGFADRGVLVAWERQFPNVTGETLRRFHSLANEISERVARDSAVEWVTTSTAFEGRWRESFADFVHFTDEGSARVAAVLARAVLRASSTCLGPTH
jgi:hypothetical protein